MVCLKAETHHLVSRGLTERTPSTHTRKCPVCGSAEKERGKGKKAGIKIQLLERKKEIQHLKG